MENNALTIVDKMWNYCSVLRDDGVSYGDYVQQLTNLLFLKMDHEYTKPPHNKKSLIPKKYNWSTIVSKKGEELETHYRNILIQLGKEPKLLGLIYRKSQNKIQSPAKLEKLINLLDETTWIGLGSDIIGDIYEGLLEKNAEDVKNGAGQYFTPRSLISAMVKVIDPKPGETVCDPACGTGGFFLSAYDHINKKRLDRNQKKFLKEKTFTGFDISDEVVRLCAMNMYLYGIGKTESQITNTDSLLMDTDKRFDIVLTNPPFGKKSSTVISNGDSKKRSDVYERDDFWTTTSNKQLNFLQHVKSILKVNGRCGIVVPDGVLFEGGAGEVIRKKLLETCNLHTILRLPTGIFYVNVKANVLFFEKKTGREYGKPQTKKVWFYDFRTDIHFTKKENRMKASDLDDFVKCYNSKNILARKETERFKSYTYEEILERDNTSLDIFWLKDKSFKEYEKLPEPAVLAKEISTGLNNAVKSVNLLIDELK